MAGIIPTPAEGPLEVLFTVATTDSMYAYLDKVRRTLRETIQGLQADIPGIRIAVLEHGDYSDLDSYVGKWEDFSTDTAKLNQFVENIGKTGGDADGCYELVMNEIRTELSWTPGTRRALVMIGDNNPHEPDYYLNTDKLDWRQEARALARMGVSIYGVQCGNVTNAKPFYNAISVSTGGIYLQLDSMDVLVDIMMAVRSREGNNVVAVAEVENEVCDRCGIDTMRPDDAATVATLRDDVCDTALPTPSTSSVAVPGLFAPKTAHLTFPTVRPGGVERKSTKCIAKKRTSLKSKELKRVSRRLAKNKEAKLPKALLKYKQKNLPALRRENVPETNFILRAENWSPWVVVLRPDAPESLEPCGRWERRRGKLGYRKHQLSSYHSHSASHSSLALFEVAVRAPGRRRHVIYSGFSSRCLGTHGWERRLLRGVKGQVEGVLRNGCEVLVRYLALGTKSEVASTKREIKKYDYAWRKARDVCKGGVKLSCSM